MKREEWQDSGVCARCGAEVGSEAEQGFEFGVGNKLCWTCAVKRGGQYDAERDVWSVAPDVADLPDEAYGSAPPDVQKRMR